MADLPKLDTLTPEDLRDLILDHTRRTVGKNRETLNADDWYKATAFACRDLMAGAWLDSHRRRSDRDEKQVYYLSMEFLIGRSLSAHLLNLGLYETARKALALLGQDWKAIAFREAEAGLGNGGLGRLAACLMESLATVDIPAYGYGLRYDYGMFRQRIDEAGRQVEEPDNWHRHGNPWEFVREKEMFSVQFGGRVMEFTDAQGRLRHEWVDGERVMAVGRDQAVTGYRSRTMNTIRLWKAEPIKGFDLRRFNTGDYVDAVREGIESQNLSRILYPDDSNSLGRELRFKQEYFLVCASLQDILRRFLKTNHDLRRLPEKVAIQLNDTHPAIAVPELMRLLVDHHGLGWEEAWRACVGTFGYTNHTVMPEALETWPVEMFERILPRHTQIIYEINARFLRQVQHTFPGEFDLYRRVSIIDDTHGPEARRVRMAHLAFVGSHRVNGVARVHTDLIRAGLFADLDRCLPGRIVNKTNGITPRRWMMLANRKLSGLLDARIGDGWRSDLAQLRRLEPFADDAGFRAELAAVKRANKERLGALIRQSTGLVVDPASLFDVQVKRIHEYKRQLLNLLHVVTLYSRIREGRLENVVPRTVIFGGKAAPGYAVAKQVIALIHDIAALVSHDPASRDLLKVAFVPNYDVSSAQIIIPAADLSEQISTAGTEASGTGNMKLALNGALTIGTMDGANIEMAEEIGQEAMFIFGLSPAEADAIRRHRRQRGAELVAADAELAHALALIRDGFFSPDDRDRYRGLIDGLVAHDEYLLLADYRAYVQAQEHAARVFRDPDDWHRRATLNIARMGRFSSDRTVLDYAGDVWGVAPRDWSDGAVMPLRADAAAE
ncbi:glycogen/starch/alpha-glucan phosphorylase [Novispirillum sp. DQ9]|uniref:glycogen/starch/alpha-glucan phosphorylase n=1 Tax=Novispirillum sp. DQ9 TaxID=3398612 RepID=UPI003C7D5110